MAYLRHMAATKSRPIRSPLYRFAVAGETYTAEGERRSDSDDILVTLHLGYPRQRVIATATTKRTKEQRVEDTIMNAAARLVVAQDVR